MLHQKPITCTRLDGTTVEITVRALPLSQIEKFLDCQGDPAAALTLTTGLTEAEQDALIGSSSFALLEVADELNDPLARRWMDRQTVLIQRLKEARAKLGPAPLPTPSPSSSSSAVPPTGIPPKSSPSPAPSV